MGLDTSTTRHHVASQSSSAASGTLLVHWHVPELPVAVLISLLWQSQAEPRAPVTRYHPKSITLLQPEYLLVILILIGSMATGHR